MENKTQENYQRWLNSSVVSEEDKAKLKSMSDTEIDDAFFQDIEFGTAGMRGILGPGTNRINFYTIRKACVGFGLYLLKHFKFPQSCAISHDYAVRAKKASGGIMITASHNPKEDNGFKVYDEFGCQLVPNKIKDLIDIIATLGDELTLKVPQGEHLGENYVLPKSIDDNYVDLCKSVQINPNLNKKDFKIVYTPNHGTSYVNAMRVFNECGYKVYPVLSQCNPDPAFSGTLSPNPEDPRSYIEPIKLAKEVDADIIVMTDPDGDRVGLACKDGKGDYTLITGNEGAAILLDYVLSERIRKKEMTKDPVVYNTVVSSSLGREICDHYGVRCESFLTGFKYIGDRIRYYEVNGGPQFIFGYEESYGCLIKPFVRDKDGIQAILLYSEAALWYKQHGLTLFEAYKKLGDLYGQHKSKLYNIYFKGSQGHEEMQKIMKDLEEHPITELCGNKVKVIENYFELISHNLDTNESRKIENLPKGDLIKFIFEDRSSICVRPSGTEPKCKFYIEVVDKDLDVAASRCDKFYKALLERLNIKA